MDKMTLGQERVPVKPDWLRVADLRDEYGIARASVYRLLAEGAIVAKRVNGTVLIPRASVDALLARAPYWAPAGGER